MDLLRRVFPRPVVVACLTAVVISLVVLAFEVRQGPDDPHRLTLGIAAPTIVAQALVAETEGLPGQPFAVRMTTDARTAVRDGAVFAAVAVDPTATSDVLYVSTVADPGLNDVTRQRIAALEASYQRRLTVTEVPPGRNAGTGRTAEYLLTAGWIIAGFACAAGLTVVRGPVAATFRRAAARIAGLAAAAAGIAAVLALVVPIDGFLPLWLAGTATMLAAAWTTLALEGLAGLAGIGVATVVFTLLAGPLLLAATDPAVLPTPWREANPWTLHGAALAIAYRVVHFDAAPVLRAMAVLAAWLLLPLLTMAVARRERQRDPSAGQRAAG